jgi:hypothetical protein
MVAATMPIGIPIMGEMKPEPGVTAPNPATAPVTIPVTVGRRKYQLRHIHVKAPAAADILVVTKVLAARPELRALLRPTSFVNQNKPA